MTKTKQALIIVRFLLVTGIMFLGIDHFMSNDQGWIALGIAALWFAWTPSSVSSSNEVGSSVLDSGYSNDAATSWHYSKDFE